MKYLVLLTLFIGLIGCSDTDNKKKEKEDVKAKNEKPLEYSEEELVEIVAGEYIEYYPGKKQIKMKGHHDDNHERHGKWVFYSESGIEVSTSMYKHGTLHGHSVVHYPDGKIYYYGEYKDGKKVGSWKFYDNEGELASEKDYGTGE